MFLVHLYCTFFKSIREIKTQAVNHISGKALTQSCSMFILLTLLMTYPCLFNDDVKVSVIPSVARWWQLFTIKLSAVSTLELTVITSALELSRTDDTGSGL